MDPETVDQSQKKHNGSIPIDHKTMLRIGSYNFLSIVFLNWKKNMDVMAGTMQG